MNNGKICLSVSAETAEEMLDKVARASEFADIIEIRFDSLRPEDVSKVLENVTSKKNLLATFRSTEQGGKRDLTLTERIAFWGRVNDTFWADTEEDLADTSINSVLRVASYHNFVDSDSNLDEIFERLARSGDIVKIAVNSDDICDTLPIWKLLKRSTEEKKPFVPIAMGDAGKWTRILAPAHGAFMTYASLAMGSETAPGQITAKDMANVYRVKEIDKRTQVFGVIGNPISQSMSPYMHNPSFVSEGINAVFLSLLVKNIDEFMRRMVKPRSREVELNFGGFSVTMPHKQAIMPHLDAIDPTAEKIGAVNTVKIKDGKLTGYNTDAHGFITPLKARFPDLKDARVAVIGAGGAARAVVFALKAEAARVTVFARNLDKATALAEEFEVDSGAVSDLCRAGTRISDRFDIVVDTTPTGMKGPQENESLLTAAELDGVKLVYDLVTKPSDTPILREARMAGSDAVGGLEMLISQGANQFEIWTGKPAPVAIMKVSIDRRFAELNK